MCTCIRRQRKSRYHFCHAAACETHVLEGVDALGGLLDLAANDFGDQLGGELLESAAAGLALDDLGHLPADGADLG